jgi:hypothetical protein
MREGLGSYLDDEDPGILEETISLAMEKIKRECARWMGNLDAATWIARHTVEEPEGFTVEGHSITPEEAERVHRLITRADRLADAARIVYETKTNETDRWSILNALYEAHEKAEEETDRFRSGSPA